MRSTPAPELEGPLVASTIAAAQEDGTKHDALPSGAILQEPVMNPTAESRGLPAGEHW